MLVIDFKKEEQNQHDCGGKIAQILREFRIIVDMPKTYPWALIMQTHEQDICVYICVSNLSGYKIGCKRKCIHSFNVTTCSAFLF